MRFPSSPPFDRSDLIRWVSMGREGELELVRHMRIDFNLIPVKGRVTYSSGLERQIMGKVKEVIGKKDKNLNLKIEICPGDYSAVATCMYPTVLRSRRFSGDNLEQQLRDGGHGYIVIWDGFRFVDRYPGDDWDDKFRNARQSLIHELNCTFYEKESQLLITHLNPSQDARLFINILSSSSSSSSTAPQPTLVLKNLPQYQSGLQDFFCSLAKTRDLDVERDRVRGKNVYIQFKNYKKCYKLLKKLCSHSFIEDNFLKQAGKDKDLVVYDLTLKDDSLVSNVFDEVLGYKYNGYKAYSQSATTQALNNRVAMLEKEFNIVKDMTENSKVLKGSAGARALKYRGAMLEKRLDIVTSVMKEFGAGYNESPSTLALRNRVSVLNDELSTIKPVLEDACIPMIEALETRVAMLEKELKTMKDGMMSKKRKKKDEDGINESAGGYDKSPTDRAVIKRCKRLTGD